MKEQTNYDYEKYVQIAQMAKMGWWESDLKNKEYICSDFIVDLLGLECFQSRQKTGKYGCTLRLISKSPIKRDIGI